MISREEAVKHLEDIKGFIFDPKWKESMVMAIEALSQPERPKGRWKRYKYSHKLGECSLCGEIVGIRSNYCPNCGADMRDGEEK